MIGPSLTKFKGVFVTLYRDGVLIDTGKLTPYEATRWRVGGKIFNGSDVKSISADIYIAENGKEKYENAQVFI